MGIPARKGELCHREMEALRTRGGAAALLSEGSRCAEASRRAAGKAFTAVPSDLSDQKESYKSTPNNGSISGARAAEHLVTR